MSKRKKVVVEKITDSDRDYHFQKLLSLKNETSQLLDTIRKEIPIEDYSYTDWMRKSREEIGEAKESIVSLISEPNLRFKNQGVWRSFMDLSEKHNKRSVHIFQAYIDSYIAGPTESQLIDLCGSHQTLNNLIRGFFSSVDYDRASHGE